MLLYEIGFFDRNPPNGCDSQCVKNITGVKDDVTAKLRNGKNIIFFFNFDWKWICHCFKMLETDL